MLGAFGAHGLKQRIADPARIANWGTAAQYQVRVYPHKTEIKPAFLFFVLLLLSLCFFLVRYLPTVHAR
jgi:hypothetical protein